MRACPRAVVFTRRLCREGQLDVHQYQESTYLRKRARKGDTHTPGSCLQHLLVLGLHHASRKDGRREAQQDLPVIGRRPHPVRYVAVAGLTTWSPCLASTLNVASKKSPIVLKSLRSSCIQVPARYELFQRAGRRWTAWPVVFVAKIRDSEWGVTVLALRCWMR
jgi:hypothetical protein